MADSDPTLRPSGSGPSDDGASDDAGGGLGFALPPLPSLDYGGDVEESIADGLSFPPISPESIARVMRSGPDDDDADDAATISARRRQLAPRPAAGSGGSEVSSPDLRYDDANLLARGGMGMVLSVTDRRLNRAVAMKLIRRDRTGDPQVRARFLREAQVHAQLEHPNIVPVHDLVESDSTHTYFTMKLVRGRSLAALIRDLRADVVAGRGEGQFPLTDRLEVFRKVCDAIGFSNARGVIHRDLKPDNIMVGEFGEVQVMDWGLARLMDADDDAHATSAATAPTPVVAAPTTDVAPGAGTASTDTTTTEVPLTHAETHANTRSGDTSHSQAVRVTDDASDAGSVDGDVLGTPQYMAPEQARGESDRLDQRADVYALGTILYELLTLKPAFSAGLLFGVLHRVSTGSFDKPTRSVAADDELATRAWRVPAELEAIVLKAMATNPDDRYPTASDLRRDVGEFIGGRIVSAARYSLLTRLRRWVRANRVAVGVVALMLLMGAGGVVASIASARSARDAVLNRMRAGLDAATATRDEIAAKLQAGRYEAAVELAAQFQIEHQPALTALQDNEVVQADRAGWSADAAALAPAVQSLRNDALVAWATRDLAALPRGANRASVSDATIEAAAASWRRFEPWLDTDDLRIRLPIAEIAYWLASAEAARLAAAEQAGGDEASVGRHRAQMSYWVAAAWQEQPLSPAVGRGLLLLADHQLAHSESVEQAQQLVQQYAAAATMNAGHEPWLEARALIGLARAQLAVPGAGAPENALIALLRVIQPDGSPRPAYATPPDDDATQLLADAADLLMIARRICAPAGDADNGNVCRLPDGNLCIGSTTGARILVVEQPTDAGALPLRLLQGGRALIGVGVARCEFFNGRADGRTPVAMITVPGHENERVTIADPRDPSSHVVELPHSVIDIVSGDFNGDGLPDVAVVQLDTDDAGVLVSDRQLVIVGLVDANDSVTSAHVVWAGRSPRLRAADLDQDGRDELVICDNGRMAVFDADVAPLGEHDQLDPSKAPVLPSVAVGRTLANVVDMAGQRALAVCGWYSDLELAQRQVAGESMRSRPRFFRYHDGAIDEADAPPWHVRADDRPLPDGRGFEVVRLDAGRIALIDRMQRGNWQLCRWLLADGDARPGGTGSVASHAIGTSCRELGDGVFATPSGFTRRLSDADLAVLATQPLRTGRSGRALQTEDRQLALLRMLLWFGQADTVIASVLPRIQDQYEADPQTQPREQPPAGHPALIGERLALLILQAWLESSQLSCALKLAYALPLQSRYVEHVLLVVDEVLRRSGNVEAVAPLLERWSTGWSLTAGERQRVRSRQRQVTRIIEALQSGAIEIIGRSARFSSHEFDKHVYDVSTIDHFCITNDPALAHATHDGWHMVADGRNYRLAIDADGNTAPPFAGVPIWLSGDVVRMVMDFRLLALEPGATPGIGLFAVRRGTVDRPDTVTGPTADALGIGGGQMLASRIGAKLRLQHDWFGPLGIERVILSDAASGEILSLELRESAGVNSKGTFAIVGVCAGSRGRCELTIERIGLNGNVWLLDDTAPEFEAMMPDDITRRVSSAARLHLSGDSADGIGEMSTLVEWLQTQRPPQYEEESAFRAFDAARWAGDAPAIARVLVRADEVLPANLVPLALRQPQARLDIELWIAVGTVWAGSPRENDAAPDPRRKALEDAELGLALAWAEAKDKRDDAACRANILEAAQRAVEAAQAQGAGTETVALQTHLVAVSRWLAALQPLTAQQRAWQLSALAATGHSRVMQRSLQKEQVTAAGFEAAYGVPSAVPVLDQLTAWLGERAAAQAARARQLGISPTDAIRPRAVDDGGADTPLELMKMWVEFVRSGDAKLLARLVTPEERGMLRPGTPAGRVAELLPRAIHLAPGQEPEVLENTLDRAALTHTLVFRWSATFDDALLREVAHERLIATVCVTRGVGSEEARKVLRDEFSDDEITNMENSLIADVHYDAQDLDMLRQGGRWYMVPPWLVDY